MLQNRVIKLAKYEKYCIDCDPFKILQKRLYGLLAWSCMEIALYKLITIQKYSQVPSNMGLVLFKKAKLAYN